MGTDRGSIDTDMRAHRLGSQEGIRYKDKDDEVVKK